MRLLQILQCCAGLGVVYAVSMQLADAVQSKLFQPRLRLDVPEMVRMSD